jgi:hypothetical protein
MAPRACTWRFRMRFEWQVRVDTLPACAHSQLRHRTCLFSPVNHERSSDRDQSSSSSRKRDRSIARIGERGAPQQRLQERTLVLARGTDHDVGHSGILVSGHALARSRRRDGWFRSMTRVLQQPRMPVRLVDAAVRPRRAPSRTLDVRAGLATRVPKTTNLIIRQWEPS